MHVEIRPARTSDFPILILGKGGFGREVYWHIRETLGDSITIGFLDETVSERHEVRLFGNWATVFKDARDAVGYQFVVGVGDPDLKERLVGRCIEAGLEPHPTIVHSSATVSHSSLVGRGGVICPGARVTCDAMIGDYVTINLNCTVGHDAKIGDFSTLHPGAHISGGVTLGKGVLVATGAVIRDKLAIPSHTVVGMQACVAAAPKTGGETLIGVPAKPVSRSTHAPGRDPRP
jgi:sugar O-acyltransferase (sialic acid O-acetyltransferase NeuD family)